MAGSSLARMEVLTATPSMASLDWSNCIYIASRIKRLQPTDLRQHEKLSQSLMVKFAAERSQEELKHPLKFYKLVSLHSGPEALQSATWLRQSFCSWPASGDCNKLSLMQARLQTILSGILMTIPLAKLQVWGKSYGGYTEVTPIQVSRGTYISCTAVVETKDLAAWALDIGLKIYFWQ